MSALIFMDTETTGLSLSDDIWEFVAIRREEDGTESELHLFIEHDRHRCARLPEPFQADHLARYPGPGQGAVSPVRAAREIAAFIGEDRPHIVGAVPNFDTDPVALMLDRALESPGWHYHLIDVETLAVGYLAAKGVKTPLPWSSDDLSRAVGVEPPTTERHTAMGDARWVRDLYDAVMEVAS